MDLPALIETLGYLTSENFLRRGTAAFDRAPDIAHILRTASLRQTCRLEGAYALRPFDKEGSPVPLVYVCEADDTKTADEIHRLVWNQDIVPFLLVRTPAGVRLYSGFNSNDTKAGVHEGILEPLIQFNEIAEKLAEFHADAIDSGELWQKWGGKVQPDQRAYWSLLENLKQLKKKFQGQFGRDKVKSIIHPLIGKYVYLHYLKDRGFLSAWRFKKWNIDPATVYGRTATVTGLRAVCKELDSFLNGRVFPLKFTGASAPTDDQVQRIAGAFGGDTFDGEWQFHLPFTAFKFDFIPIETLSMIYEQFLHLPEKPDLDEDEEHSEGRKAGAYYTPIPVVNYMLAEMDKRRRLQRGVRVWDPSCGSGAFLVQCYRRLIEREYIQRKKNPAPHELATLLKRHIFGVDMDVDACSVAEFSLYLTLLDYVKPADLKKHPRFRLPTLRKQNIFCADFFKFQPFRTKFHWAVGNPPWKKLIPGKLEERDERAMKWMRTNSKKMPVGDNSLAQAFAWRCREFMVSGGECGLLVPAMTLFEDFSEDFRSAFFREHRLHAVTNFSNATEMLFAKRSRAPAAALFFACRKKGVPVDDLEMTTVFSPLVANQEATRVQAVGARKETWSITVNGDEVRDVPFCDIASGSGLPWKLATWGSNLDSSLLGKLSRRWDRLEVLEAPWHSHKKEFIISKPTQIFKVSEGLQVRGKDAEDEVQRVAAIAEKPMVDVVALARYRRVFAFPSSSTPLLPKGKEYALKGRTERPLTVCEPPHVLVSAARNFAVYSEEFVVVPPRQIGIVSVNKNRPLLKALALYLSSDFAYYHQFLTSTQFGVKRDVATLESLRQIPIPLLKLTFKELSEWEELHDRLVKTKPRLLPDPKQPEAELDESPVDDDQDEMVKDLNQRVFDALGLDEAERALVHDLVHVRLSLNDGKIGRVAMRDADADELNTYAKWIQRELEANAEEDTHYTVTVLYDERSGFIAIEPINERTSVRVLAANSAAAKRLAETREQLREKRAQWVYFDRSLRIHRGASTYMFKPIQRMHWTRTRAMLDAADITIGELSDG
jgi:hypothetical protein